MLALPPRFGLGRLLQGGQMAGPEAVEEIAHGLQAIGAHDEEVAGPLVALGNQARAAQHAQMEGDRLLRHSDLVGDLADGAWLVAHQRQDPSAVGLGQGAQGRVEGFGSANRGTRHGLIQAHTCTSVNWNISTEAEPPILASG